MVNYEDELDIWKDRIQDRISKLEEQMKNMINAVEELRNEMYVIKTLIQ